MGKNKERNHVNDKKKNAQYWDCIDSRIEEMVHDVAKSSDVPLSKDVLEDIINGGIVEDVREMVIKAITEKGGKFPFVNEDM